MLNRLEQQHQSPRDVPPVGRPRGAAWRSLQADGVVWEGQVLLVGGDADLAARMIVTHRRVAFVRGGDVVLEIPRGWLRQEPVLRRDGILDLFVSTPDSNPFDEPQRVPLRMREGHPAAGHIIAMLAPGGVRRIAPDAVSAIERARESAPTPTFGGFWEGVEPVGAPRRPDRLPSIEPVPGVLGRPENDNPPSLAPLEPPDRLVRVPSTPPKKPVVNGFSITGLPPRDQRRSPWMLILRLAALTILLATAAALGAERLNIRLPGAGINPILAAPTATAPASATSAGSDAVAPAPSLSSEELTAVAAGVGADSDQIASAGSDTSQGAPALATQPAAAPGAVPTKPAIPTPAPTNPPEPTAAPAAAQNAAPETAVSSPPAPAQSIAQGMLIGSTRLNLKTALRGETLPKYGLPPGSGEWILLVAELKNEGDAPSSIAMNDFRLVDRGSGAVANLDAGTDVIASLAGLEPARGAADVILLDPGKSTETLLLYLVPTGSGDDLALQVGQTTLDLAPIFAGSAPAPAENQELVQTTVTTPTIEALPSDQLTQLFFMQGRWRDRWRVFDPWATRNRPFS